MDQNLATDDRPLLEAGTKLAPASGASPPPLIPDHELLRCIGRGSYGTVWLARNMMGMFRAVKIVYRDSFTDRRPFERELSGIRKFEPISRSHEGFIDVLQVGINEEQGHFYYVMELGDDQVSGQKIDPETYCPKTLDKEILLRRKLSFQECLELGVALSLALAELHKHGLVHRDVKPSNIIFVNGVPKLADIGLVAEANQAQSFVGTAGFIPPEGPGTAQADVYSLGKVLYEASTGKDRQEFPALPTLLDTLTDREGFLELNEVILHACKNDMTQRYKTAWFMHADLLVLANGKSVRRLKILEQRLSNLKRVAGVAALILVMVGVIGYQVYRERKAFDEAHQREIGANIAYGNHAMDSGDLMGALPFFTDALQLDEKNSNHRLRFGSVLAQCPKLTRIYFEKTQVEDGMFSPDGRKILIALLYGKAKIYDLQTGELYLHPFGPEQGLRTATYSPDGRFIATASQIDQASLWDAATLEEVWHMPHPDGVFSARFSIDGRRIVTACEDGFARVWNVQTRKLELSIKHGGPLRFADFSKDGELIATGGADQIARVWNATTGQAIGLPLEHGNWVHGLAFSLDGKKLVTASGDHVARVWDVATGRKISPDLIHHDAVVSVEFSPDGWLILTASLDGTVRLWRADNFQPFGPVLRHGEKVLRASFDNDGRRILTTCADGSMRIWDLAGSALPSTASGSKFSLDGERVLRIAKNRVEIQDTSKTDSIFITSSLPVENAIFSPSGRFILTLSPMRTNSSAPDCLVQAWNATTGEPVAPGLLFTNKITDGAICDDGTRLVAASGKTMQIWDVVARAALSPLLPYHKPGGSPFFSP
ncbi:MAG TPA: protein kinase, partial [Verrucomicrobiae bacterium]|nr:protein kinase [Verrucomicrobiae bacterium]